MTGARRENRGPSAAAGNRRALVAAAVVVFGERGIDAPLSAIAKRAGVGQGSLYRHFPDRMSLALAVFEENVAKIERFAALPGTTLDDLLALVTDLTIDSVAFVDIVASGGGDERLDDVTARVSAALEGPVRDARRAKTLRRSATTQDVMLAIALIAALVAKTPPTGRREAAQKCWTLLRRSLAP